MSEIGEIFEMIKNEDLQGDELEALRGVLCMIYSASLVGNVKELLFHCHPWNVGQLKILEKEQEMVETPGRDLN